jgi:hypothetical protein
MKWNRSLMKVPRLTMRQLMVIVAMAAMVSFFVTETWRRRRYHHCIVLANRHADDEAYLLVQAKKWKDAVGLADEMVKTTEVIADTSTGRLIKAREQRTRLRLIQHFYELQAAYHSRERLLFQHAADRPWEAVPARSSYYPDSNRLYQQAARME